MLLNLTVNNWMSYREETSLTLVGSRERQHAETLAKLPAFRSKKALPIAEVFGGNASGKTGLFKALACLRQMVTRDPGVDGPVPVVPFMLDGKSAASPTLLDATFLAQGVVYRLMEEATRSSGSYEYHEVVRDGSTIDVCERDASVDTFDLNQ